MRYRFLAAAVLLVCSRPCGFTQSSGEADPPREPSRPLDYGPSSLEGLSEETRERFRAAREKALDDPKLQKLRKNAIQAKREFFKAMRDKMLDIDPGLADIVKKWAVERRAFWVWREGGGLDSLSDVEREKLLRVMEQVYEDPAVEAAQKKKWQTDSSDEFKAAAENYRKVLREAITKVDPTIAPILDKLDTNGSPPPKPAADSPASEEKK
jgi:hypothetical protein